MYSAETTILVVDYSSNYGTIHTDARVRINEEHSFVIK